MRFRILTLAVLSIPAVALAFSSGYHEKARTGCTGNGCHALVASPTTRVCIEGLPTDGTYAPGTTYDLNVFVDGAGIPASANGVTGLAFGGRVAGFAFEASAGQVASLDGSAWIIDSAASHTSDGNVQNHWSLRWTAPASGTVTLWLAGNAVNNSGAADAGDLWNRMEMDLAPGAGAGAGEGIYCDPPIPLPQLVPRPAVAPALAAH